MPSFLIEIYAPSSTALPELIEAAKSVARGAAPVGYVDSIYVPEDETCFHVFAGPSAAVVSDAARRAALPFQRVVEVVESPRGTAERPAGISIEPVREPSADHQRHRSSSERSALKSR